MSKLLLVILVVVAIVFSSCKKEEEEEENTDKGIIKGRISQDKTKASIGLSEATKILVINVHIGSLSTHFVDIQNGEFLDSIEIGQIAAYVFLNDQNQYIGTLACQELNLLPFCNLSNGENTSIDLLDLSLVGTSVIPSHDPLGNEIIISDSEINSLLEISGFFETLSKNIDSDNDGNLDILDNKQLFIKTRFNLSAGQWGLNNSDPVFSESMLGSLSYALEINGGSGYSHPSSIVLSGPAENAHTDISQVCNNSDGNGGFYAVFARESSLAFNDGIYTICIDGNDHTMNFSNIDAGLHLLIVLPTLQTNSEGKLVSFTLEYRLPDNTIVDPVNILTDVMLQFNDSEFNQFYNSPRLINEGMVIQGCDCIQGLYSYTLDTPIDITALEMLSVGYNDLLGNSYSISFYR
jgi:hypothetical protein